MRSDRADRYAMNFEYNGTTLRSSRSETRIPAEMSSVTTNIRDSMFWVRDLTFELSRRCFAVKLACASKTANEKPGRLERKVRSTRATGACELAFSDEKMDDNSNG